MTADDKRLLFGLDVGMVPMADETLRTLHDLEARIYAWRYAQFDAAMGDRSTHIGESHLRAYLHNKQFHPSYAAVHGVKRISMLHEDVLLLLNMYASATRSAILEIGPYVGGSTIALASGVARNGTRPPFVSVELGGSYPTHPHVPTDDIFKDLVKNVDAAGLGSHVRLVNGNARQPKTIDTVRQVVAERKIGLLFIDADGDVEADWQSYSGLLAPDAVIVLDDYEAPLAPDKAASTSAWVHKMLSTGAVRQLGVFGWGTWFGQLTQKSRSTS